MGRRLDVCRPIRPRNGDGGPCPIRAEPRRASTFRPADGSDAPLEAIKVLPDVGENDPPRAAGPITLGSVAKVEVESPERNRVLCMAVTAGDKEEWLPTLWSSAIDRMSCGATDDTRRLMLVSAGNYPDELKTADYPSLNHELSVEDPAQGWNVVTVGAYRKGYD